MKNRKIVMGVIKQEISQPQNKIVLYWAVLLSFTMHIKYSVIYK